MGQRVALGRAPAARWGLPLASLAAAPPPRGTSERSAPTLLPGAHSLLQLRRVRFAHPSFSKPTASQSVCRSSLLRSDVPTALTSLPNHQAPQAQAQRTAKPTNLERAQAFPEGGATPILATNPRRPGNALFLSRARPRGGCRSGTHAGLPVSGRAAAPGSASRGIGRNARGGNQRPEPFGLSSSPPGPGRRHAGFLPEVSWTPFWGKAGRGSSPPPDSHKAASSSSWKGQKSPPLTRWRTCSFVRNKWRHLTCSPEFRMR